MNLAELVPTLQTAVGPVILISGVGLLLLGMTNRLGRIVDRSRALAHERRQGNAAALGRIEAQLAILARRARLVRAAIWLATVSVLTSALLVITLFLGALARVDLGWLVAALFVGGMTALIAALVLFLRDVNLGLSALAYEVGARERER
jgi:hypothetical protein